MAEIDHGIRSHDVNRQMGEIRGDAGSDFEHVVARPLPGPEVVDDVVPRSLPEHEPVATGAVHDVARGRGVSVTPDA